MKKRTADSVQRIAAGFTLIEALVALALLTVGLIPAFQQATDAVVLASSIRNSLAASNFAQEGAEVVRSIRDANWFAGDPFDTGLDGCASGCRVEYGSTDLLPLDGNPVLKQDEDSGLFQYQSGEDTLFSRRITIQDESDHQLAVSVLIEWRERTGSKSFELEYHLYDWLQ
jgi:type II secretory pathway pseudopilin PulG